MDANVTPESNTSDLVEVDAPTVFEIPSYRLEEFSKRVEKANRRLARANAAERFECKWEVQGYDETKPLSDHWLSSKAEIKRFAKWQANQA
jgi:hypothetical protein